MLIGKRRLTLVMLGLLLVACGRAAPSGQQATSATTTQAVAFCGLRVDGRWISMPSGQPVVLHGANLPTLTAMEASTYQPDARLRDLAVAGARIVHLPVNENELSPTFVPAKVAPFAEQANQLGMVVVLSWNAEITQPINTTVDDADDWVRLVIMYLSNRPGVWFEPYQRMSNVSPARQRNIVQRLIDVARGYRANNIFVINDPVWLLDPDPAVNQPLSGVNIVYAIDAPALTSTDGDKGYPVEQFPFLVTRWAGSADTPAFSKALADVKSLSLGTLASLDEQQAPGIPAALSEFWQANAVDWSTCR